VSCRPEKLQVAVSYGLPAVALAVVLSLSSCEAGGPASSIAGFVSACPQRNWEACRRRDNSLDRASIESFQRMLDRAFDDAYSVSSLRKSTTKEQFERLIVRDPTTAFLFDSTTSFRTGKAIRTIRTSSETFATISKITIARHLARLPRFSDSWLAKYLLFIRKTPDGTVIIDPLRASGLVSREGKATPGVPDFTPAIREGIEDTHAVITFMVGHELYHLERPLVCAGSAEQCNALRREDEANADGYSVQILHSLELKDPSGGYRLAIPAYVFSQLMLTMEGSTGRSPIVGGQHPPNHERLRSAALAIRAWCDSNPSDASSAADRDLADSALKIVADIDRETPSKYFSAVDAEASAVTLASLKIY